jgi:hypothetical protein
MVEPDEFRFGNGGAAWGHIHFTFETTRYHLIHVVVVPDSTYIKALVYLDGVLQGTIAGGIAANTTFNKINIATDTTLAAGWMWTGKFVSCALWSRSLAVSEIIQNCASLYGTPSQPRFLYAAPRTWFIPAAAAPSFPTTGILDGFNRDNEGPPPNANWSKPFGGILGEFKVVSNQCVVDQILNGGCYGYWGPATFGPDCEFYATVIAVPTTGDFSLFARAADVTGFVVDAYGATWVHDGTIRIIRSDDGDPNHLLATGTQALSAGDKVGIQIIGSTIRMWYKPVAGSWTVLLTAVDATYSAAGYLMLGAEDPDVIFDDVGGGTYIPVGAFKPYWARNSNSLLYPGMST